jgi:hypothetical protein
MDGTGEPHLKWSQPGSEGLRLYFVSQLWNRDSLQIHNEYI